MRIGMAFAVGAGLLVLHLVTTSSHQVNDDFQSESYQAEMMWGTYRPNLYFGMKTRQKEPLMTGLMWHGVDDEISSLQNVRHTCEEADGMSKYGWNLHDGRKEIVDGRLKVKLKTSFVKRNGGWSVRIRGDHLSTVKSAPPTNISVIFYAGFEGSGDMKFQDLKTKPSGPVIVGSKDGIGNFRIHFPPKKGNVHPKEIAMNRKAKQRGLPDLTKPQTASLKLAKGEVWKVKDAILPRMAAAQQKLLGQIQKSVEKQKRHQGGPSSHRDHGLPPSLLSPTLPDIREPNSNVFLIQQVFTLPFEFDVALVSEDGAVDDVTGDKLTESSLQLLEMETKAFDKRFESTFQLEAKGYSKDKQRMGKAALSNMIGSIGYYYGSSVVLNKIGKDAEVAPQELFTGAPSRPFFPRGFMWDEGFHQLMIVEWDKEISKDILWSWLSLVDKDGWVGREQILGDEARSKVPRKFQAQNREYANPPTLMLAVDKLRRKTCQRLVGSEGSTFPSSFDLMVGVDSTDENRSPCQLPDNGDSDVEYLRQVFPILKRQYHWYLTKQAGDIQGTFRWRGKDEDHTLTSGLDDYPRGPIPLDSEKHVDLHSWMVTFSALLGDLATSLGSNSKVVRDNQFQFLVSLNENHWNDRTNTFCDFAGIDFPNPKGTRNSTFVEHEGYLSIFPLLLGLVPPSSPTLKPLINLIHDPTKLWSSYGIRSLSLTDPAFGTKENYWRGPIWFNINYLLLSSLKRYYSNGNSHSSGHFEEQIRNIYEELRSNLINNIHKQFRSSGYLWEQYNPHDGSGQRSHPFTGWTGLILLAMAELY